ncbi:MAG: hypothetical protein H6745_02745 [Deltaproteobacteria bacterium]|nr:hypothetical protein [Deltaproteobacteria bacterium]
MKLLVAGYPQDETRRLSERLREEGHQVLGAVGRHGARTFVKVVTPDCVLVPAGEDGERVRGWLEELGVDLKWVAVDEGEDPVAALERFRSGGSGSRPTPRPPQAPSGAAPAEAILEVDPPDATKPSLAAVLSQTAPFRQGPITDTFGEEQAPIPRTGRRVSVGSQWPGSGAKEEAAAPKAPLERRPVAPNPRAGGRQLGDTPEAPTDPGGGAPYIVDPVVLSRRGVGDTPVPGTVAPVGPSTSPDSRVGAASQVPSRSGQPWVAAGGTVVPSSEPDTARTKSEAEAHPRDRHRGEDGEPARVKVPTGNVATEIRRKASSAGGAKRASSPGMPVVASPPSPASSAGSATSASGAVSPGGAGPASQRAARPDTARDADGPPRRLVSTGGGAGAATATGVAVMDPRTDREVTAPVDAQGEAGRDGGPILDAELVSKLAHARFGDYHSILEIEPDASPYVVREQFKRLSNLYSPRGWPKKLGPEELAMLSEIGRSVRDAFLILGDPELRARYERALIGAPASRR